MDNFIVKINEFIKILNNNLNHKIKLEYVFKKIYSIDELIKYVKNNDINDNAIQFEILNILNNFGYALLAIIHYDKVINLFDNKFSSFLITILNLCKTNNEYTIGNQGILNIRNIHFITNILFDLFNISIKEEYIKKAFDFYTIK